MAVFLLFVTATSWYMYECMYICTYNVTVTLSYISDGCTVKCVNGNCKADPSRCVCDIGWIGPACDSRMSYVLCNNHVCTLNNEHNFPSN